MENLKNKLYGKIIKKYLTEKNLNGIIPITTRYKFNKTI